MARHIFAFIIFMGTHLAIAYPTPVDFDGTIQRWSIDEDDAPISYNIEADEYFLERLGPYIDQAAQIWTEVDSSYFAYERSEDGERGQVTIYLKSQIQGGDYSAGFATFDERIDDEISHCTIEILVSRSMSVLSFSKTILHELGHCVGLGHSMIPESIMSYELDANSFSLDTDDIAAVSRLYPVDGAPPALPPGCGIGIGRWSRPFAFFMLCGPVLLLMGWTRFKIFWFHSVP